MVPGFNDAHWHLPLRQTADLTGAGTADEIVQRLKAFATGPADAWVLGDGWGPSDFPGLQPHRRHLDAAFPDRPVLITDRDGHQVLVNGRTLALAGITRDTPIRRTAASGAMRRARPRPVAGSGDEPGAAAAAASEPGRRGPRRPRDPSEGSDLRTDIGAGCQCE